MEKGCKHKGCKVKHHCGGYCSKHYGQFKKWGETFNVTSKDLNEVVEKKNHYELILTNKAMKEVGRAKIDKEDLEKVQSLGRWALTFAGYVRNTSNNVMMHRVVMGVDKSIFVDHKKTGLKHRSDNRKLNLRICSSSKII